MRDLYALIGLDPLEDKQEKISSAIYSANLKDKDQIANILLNKKRKQVYDRTYKTLQIVKVARQQHRIENTDCWSASQHSDIRLPKEKSQEEPSSQQSQQSTSESRSFTPTSSLDTVGPPNFFKTLISHPLFIVAFVFTLIKGCNEVLDHQSYVNAVKPKSNDYSELASELFASTNTPAAQEGGDIPINAVMHVTAEALNIRSEPTVSSAVITQLRKWDTVTVLALENESWYSIITDEGIGHVSSKYLSIGDGSQAYEKYCRSTVSSRPNNGFVFESTGTGENQLEISSPPNADVIVKLKSRTGSEVLHGYVRSGMSYKFESIPDGNYELQFMTGSAYSKDCQRFTQNISVQRSGTFDQYETTDTYSTIYSVQLTEVVNGNFRPKDLPLNSF